MINVVLVVLLILPAKDYMNGTKEQIHHHHKERNVFEFLINGLFPELSGRCPYPTP